MPTYECNWFGQNRYRATSSEPLPLGKSTIRVEFKYDSGGPAKGGNVTMCLNDKKVAEGRVERTIFGRFSADETFGSRPPYRLAGQQSLCLTVQVCGRDQQG
jgi:arylsulfatase